MKSILPIALSTLVVGPVLAEETRQHDSHEHGVGELNIAIDGQQVAMELHVPGADIVGFEYKAESDEDIAKISAALEVLKKPLDLFVFDAAAGCSVVEATAGLEGEEGHDHDDHDDHKEDHDDHDEHDDHKEDHEDHEGHEDLDHDKDHEDHADEDHEDHQDEAQHTEFFAEYLMSCENLAKASSVTFTYFDVFPNAQEVEVQVLGETGAVAFEVERADPILDLSKSL